MVFYKISRQTTTTKRFCITSSGCITGPPKSARLWAKLIDKIICKLNLQPCTHEPCLYFTKNYNNTGKTVLFLWQVNNFAVVCEDRNTAKTAVLKQINDKMTIDVKDFGQISRSNGVDVLQTREYVKLYNKVYINKILTKHEWISKEVLLQQYLTLMQLDSSYQQKLENTEVPAQEEIATLKKEYGFGYHQAIDKLIYALVTC
jgi:hypothetical protein